MTLIHNHVVIYGTVQYCKKQTSLSTTTSGTSSSIQFFIITFTTPDSLNCLHSVFPSSAFCFMAPEFFQIAFEEYQVHSTALLSIVEVLISYFSQLDFNLKLLIGVH